MDVERKQHGTGPGQITMAEVRPRPRLATLAEYKLHEFNVALLAKQGWRLLMSPDSLVCKLLKEGYLSSCGFLDAKLGSNPRYIWRSILTGQALLKEGVVRRIGDGTESLIWGVPWLADPDNPRLHTPPIYALAQGKVSGLLNDMGNWDVDIVRDIFEPSDVPRILSTPVSPNNRDIWRWQGDVRGIYSVRHGYSTVLLLTNALCNSTLKEAVLAVAKLWMIWAARNEVVWKGAVNVQRTDVNT
nr:uncharacterized protein LOC109159798 [Ipomoea batatas]